LVHLRAELDWSLVADQLNETVIKRVIQHDLRVGERGRKRDASLLEELFGLACRYAGQSPSADLFSREVQRALGANVGRQRVAAYLRFLGDALLLRVVPPLEIRLKRQKGNAKMCLVDHGLRASWLQEIIPLASPSPAR
jgi:predicted AAA+ superfamily ATPase